MIATKKRFITEFRVGLKESISNIIFTSNPMQMFFSLLDPISVELMCGFFCDHRSRMCNELPRADHGLFLPFL